MTKKFKHLNRKHTYRFNDVSDRLLGTLKLVDGDSYPNIEKVV